MIVKNVDVEIDEKDILDDIDGDTLIDYCKEYDLIENDYSEINFADLADAVYHHDFDIEKFLEYIDYKPKENK